MEKFKIQDLTFTYPKKEQPALLNINLTINAGEFITLCGKSGCGKSTLLRQLKPMLSPHGKREGQIEFERQNLLNLSQKEQSTQIGFIFQDPDNQIVCDKVWHELAFGLENLAYPTKEIRGRVAEMASFFGIQEWFYKQVWELSGGQKQLLNLASVMVIKPSVLILDEPTSQLDPIAAFDFLKALSKINKELGTTIILSEHRLEEAFALSDRVVVMENGKIIADDTPCKIGEALKETQNDMVLALPTPMRVYYGVKNDEVCPVTVKEGRDWLLKMPVKEELHLEEPLSFRGATPVLELKHISFRYEKDQPDILKDFSLKVYEKQLYALVGGNGVGKTTALSVILKINQPYRGKVCVAKGKKVVLLPQNPQTLFLRKTVWLDLYEMLSESKEPRALKDEKVKSVIQFCELEALLQSHPYDLSGGEQQRVALAKVLLTQPDVLVLDEPTKGLDGHFKQKLAKKLQSLKEKGVAILMVSHDIEFCAKYADYCGMLFDGQIVSQDIPRKFFLDKSFYTTAANRMAQNILPQALLEEDIITMLGGKVQGLDSFSKEIKQPTKTLKENIKDAQESTKKSKENILQESVEKESISDLKKKGKLSKRTFIAMLIILLVVPFTIGVGVYCLEDRKYYFISLLIILETLIPFMLIFEGRKPKPRELVIISVLCAIAVAGRGAFAMIPQFKPVVAIVIISGVCLGGETGFLVGAITAFVSNFFFGQGPWTPWQMFSFGIIGFLAGLLFQKGILKKAKLQLCIFGFLATFIIYGGIMNPASVLMWQAKPTASMFLSAYIMGIPFDLIHGASTVFFLWFAAESICEKLDRIKIKYGLIE